MWKNFTTKEVVNPLFDDCPAKRWEELPEDIKEHLFHTMLLVQGLREYIGLPIRLNSTYRPKSKGSAHGVGKAIDLQFVGGSNQTYLKAVNWLLNKCEIKGFRVFLEWSGGDKKKSPWLHIDRGFRDNGKKVFRIAFPTGGKYRGKMNYVPYAGKLPQDHV